jgi:hypothetical protein
VSPVPTAEIGPDSSCAQPGRTDHAAIAAGGSRPGVAALADGRAGQPRITRSGPPGPTARPWPMLTNRVGGDIVRPFPLMAHVKSAPDVGAGCEIPTPPLGFSPPWRRPPPHRGPAADRPARPHPHPGGGKFGRSHRCGAPYARLRQMTSRTSCGLKISTAAKILGNGEPRHAVALLVAWPRIRFWRWPALGADGLGLATGLRTRHSARRARDLNNLRWASAVTRYLASYMLQE